MREFAQRHFLQAAESFRRGVTGQTVKFSWRASHTGTWDDARQEYIGGTETRGYIDDVPCLVYHISANDIQYGDWGSAQIGDLIIGFDPSLDLDDFPDLIIYYHQKEYRPEPHSDVPMDSLALIIGDAQGFLVIHCRYVGEQSGVI